MLPFFSDEQGGLLLGGALSDVALKAKEVMAMSRKPLDAAVVLCVAICLPVFGEAPLQVVVKSVVGVADVKVPPADFVPAHVGMKLTENSEVQTGFMSKVELM
jgi:hypothetical protein